MENDNKKSNSGHPRFCLLEKLLTDGEYHHNEEQGYRANVNLRFVKVSGVIGSFYHLVDSVEVEVNAFSCNPRLQTGWESHGAPR
jgi:hypothetical protein